VGAEVILPALPAAIRSRKRLLEKRDRAVPGQVGDRLFAAEPSLLRA